MYTFRPALVMLLFLAAASFPVLARPNWHPGLPLPPDDYHSLEIPDSVREAQDGIEGLVQLANEGAQQHLAAMKQTQMDLIRRHLFQAMPPRWDPEEYQPPQSRTKNPCWGNILNCHFPPGVSKLGSVEKHCSGPNCSRNPTNPHHQPANPQVTPTSMTKYSEKNNNPWYNHHHRHNICNLNYIPPNSPLYRMCKPASLVPSGTYGTLKITTRTDPVTTPASVKKVYLPVYPDVSTENPQNRFTLHNLVYKSTTLPSKKVKPTRPDNPQYGSSKSNFVIERTESLEKATVVPETPAITQKIEESILPVITSTEADSLSIAIELNRLSTPGGDPSDKELTDNQQAAVPEYSLDINLKNESYVASSNLNSVNPTLKTATDDTSNREISISEKSFPSTTTKIVTTTTNPNHSLTEAPIIAVSTPSEETSLDLSQYGREGVVIEETVLKQPLPVNINAIKDTISSAAISTQQVKEDFPIVIQHEHPSFAINNEESFSEKPITMSNGEHDLEQKIREEEVVESVLTETPRRDDISNADPNNNENLVNKTVDINQTETAATTTTVDLSETSAEDTTLTLVPREDLETELPNSTQEKNTLKSQTEPKEKQSTTTLESHLERDDQSTKDISNIEEVMQSYLASLLEEDDSSPVTLFEESPDKPAIRDNVEYTTAFTETGEDQYTEIVKEDTLTGTTVPVIAKSPMSKESDMSVTTTVDDRELNTPGIQTERRTGSAKEDELVESSTFLDVDYEARTIPGEIEINLAEPNQELGNNKTYTSKEPVVPESDRYTLEQSTVVTEFDYTASPVVLKNETPTDMSLADTTIFDDLPDTDIPLNNDYSDNPRLSRRYSQSGSHLQDIDTTRTKGDKELILTALEKENAFQRGVWKFTNELYSTDDDQSRLKRSVNQNLHGENESKLQLNSATLHEMLPGDFQTFSDEERPKEMKKPVYELMGDEASRTEDSISSEDSLPDSERTMPRSKKHLQTLNNLMNKPKINRTVRNTRLPLLSPPREAGVVLAMLAENNNPTSVVFEDDSDEDEDYSYGDDYDETYEEYEDDNPSVLDLIRLARKHRQRKAMVSSSPTTLSSPTTTSLPTILLSPTIPPSLTTPLLPTTPPLPTILSSPKMSPLPMTPPSSTKPPSST